MTPFMFPEINPKSKIKWQKMSPEERRQFTKNANKGISGLIACLAFVIGFLIPITGDATLMESLKIATGAGVFTFLLFKFIDVMLRDYS